MGLRDNIRKILKENKDGFWDTETKPFSVADKRGIKFAEKILKRRHQEIKDYNSKKPVGLKSGYPDDYDQFIEMIKSAFPTYEYFHIINVLLTKEYVKDLNIPDLLFIKIVTEYILNYNNPGEQQRVDVVPYTEIFDYLNKQFFDCSDDFFKKIWDNILKKTYSFEGDVKENMWDEIKDEVIDKMELEDIDDIINQEESSFRSYWGYPIQNLGWDRYQLCDFYREHLSINNIFDYFFDKKRENVDWFNYRSHSINDAVYIINRNKFFH